MALLSAVLILMHLLQQDPLLESRRQVVPVLSLKSELTFQLSQGVLFGKSVSVLGVLTVNLISMLE